MSYPRRRFELPSGGLGVDAAVSSRQDTGKIRARTVWFRTGFSTKGAGPGAPARPSGRSVMLAAAEKIPLKRLYPLGSRSR